MGYRAINFGQEFDLINEQWQRIVSLRRLEFRDLRSRPANYDHSGAAFRAADNIVNSPIATKSLAASAIL
jgi:hypothetical protein